MDTIYLVWVVPIFGVVCLGYIVKTTIWDEFKRYW